MADLVERLRAQKDVGDMMFIRLVPINPDGPEAADEIERLRASPLTTERREAVVDFKPDLGAGTLEPSIRQIIFTYYSHHFPVIKSGELTDRYIAALIAKLETP